MNKTLRRLAIPALSLLSSLLLTQGAEAQLRINISKVGASVAGTVRLELHTGAPPVPNCAGVEPCPGAGPHVIVAAAPVPVGPATTAAGLSASLAAALTAAGAPTTAGPNGIAIVHPPGVTHCCVNSSPEDGATGHSMVVPFCVVNNIADGVALNGAAAPTAGFTFSKSPTVPAIPHWGMLTMVLLALSGGAWVICRQRG